MKSDRRRERLKGKREVYRRSDCRQELRSCIRSGISRHKNKEIVETEQKFNDEGEGRKERRTAVRKEWREEKK